MTVAESLKRSEEFIDSAKYTSAQSLLDSVFSENPDSLKALELQTLIYNQTKKYDDAIKTARKALEIAKNDGRRDYIGKAYYWMSIAKYRNHEYEDAFKYIALAKKYADSDPQTGVFYGVARRKYKKTSGLGDDAIDKIEADVKPIEVKRENKANTETKDSKVNTETKLPTPNKSAPKLRTDWYDSIDSVDISIFVKGVDKKTAKIELEGNSVTADFQANGQKYHYEIPSTFAEIVPTKSSYTIFGTKIEIELIKKDNFKWSSLQKGLAPTSKYIAEEMPKPVKKSIDWSKINVDEDEPKGDEAAMDFFQKLYANADADTKRAMMKSYVESNGTSLSTDWSSVSKKKVETVPPEGVDAKKWEN